MAEQERAEAAASDGSNPVQVRLAAAGFNAHQQIHPSQEDISVFTPVVSLRTGSNQRVLFAGWSDTVIAGSKDLLSFGCQRIESRVEGGDASAENLRSAYGDHDGMMGCLDGDGRLYVVEPLAEPKEPGIEYRLCCQTGESSPLINHIAMTQSGRIALTFKQAPNGRLCHLAEFSSAAAFQKWFVDPSGEENYPESHHMLPGRPKQLSANTANFILLMEQGEVYTWGDARYKSLARLVTGDNTVPADKPGQVEALGGLTIVTVATGGWISAALSEDGALYVWGAMSPGSEHFIDSLVTAGVDEVALVDIPGPESEPLDVHDVAVGDNHILAVTGHGRQVFVIGDNRNGQLGIGRKPQFCSDWRKVPDIQHAASVFCGPKTSWMKIEDGQ